MSASLGSANPFRYRGYYYDTETGLYYLNARYYNPYWGRFINADSYGGSTGQLLSHNVFAYCSNNPVMNCDPSGNKTDANGGGMLTPEEVLKRARKRLVGMQYGSLSFLVGCYYAYIMGYTREYKLEYTAIFQKRGDTYKITGVYAGTKNYIGDEALGQIVYQGFARNVLLGVLYMPSYYVAHSHPDVPGYNCYEFSSEDKLVTTAGGADIIFMANDVNPYIYAETASGPELDPTKSSQAVTEDRNDYLRFGQYN